MNRPNRKLLALALLISDRAQQLHAQDAQQVESRLDALLGTLASLRRMRQQLAVCRTRGWLAATASLHERLGWMLRELPQQSSQIISLTASWRREPQLRLRQVLEDLGQLQQEFGEYQYDLDAFTLSVRTDPITLKDVELGSFEISLRLNDLREATSRQPYRIIALDPHPSSCNGEVTHPHVSEQRLCEGDATTPIRAALSEGRLCDFFMLVRSVLQHYNPSSPYVRLESWYGVSCHECGYSTNEDQRYSCDGCDEDYCQECISFCESCDSSRCRGCLDECPACRRSVCSSCRTTCKTCRKGCCERCAKEGICPDCQKEKDDEQQPQTQSTEVAAAGSDVTAPVAIASA